MDVREGFSPPAVHVLWGRCLMEDGPVLELDIEPNVDEDAECTAVSDKNLGLEKGGSQLVRKGVTVPVFGVFSVVKPVWYAYISTPLK